MRTKIRTWEYMQVRSLQTVSADDFPQSCHLLYEVPFSGAEPVKLIVWKRWISIQFVIISYEYFQIEHPIACYNGGRK